MQMYVESKLKAATNDSLLLYVYDKTLALLC